jgi:hypothetical protein
MIIPRFSMDRHQIEIVMKSSEYCIQLIKSNIVEKNNKGISQTCPNLSQWVQADEAQI